jgi:hypothetical protein
VLRTLQKAHACMYFVVSFSSLFSQIPVLDPTASRAYRAANQQRRETWLALNSPLTATSKKNIQSTKDWERVCKSRLSKNLPEKKMEILVTKPRLHPRSLIPPHSLRKRYLHGIMLHRLRTTEYKFARLSQHRHSPELS